VTTFSKIPELTVKKYRENPKNAHPHNSEQWNSRPKKFKKVVHNNSEQ
jgi:hypothetical protein